MSETVISVENISKHYRLGMISTGTLKDDLYSWFSKKESGNGSLSDNDESVWALKNVSFEVKKGEILGIVGKNGAGKSTLLKILSRVTAPSKGTIKVRGRIASLLEVGTGFHPELSGRENIFLNGAILGMKKSEIRSKFDEIVSFSGVEKYIDTPVKRYSSGMYVRLAFAVAAHLDPEILVIDEVLAVGDAEFQAKCLGKMRDVSGHGRTVLFVSHSMPAVKNLCTRAIMLEKGTVTKDGSVTEVIDRYLGSGAAISDEGVIPENASTWCTGDAKFTGIVLKKTDGTPVNTLYYEQPFMVEITLEARKDLSNLVVDLSIGDFEGRATYTSLFDADKRLSELKKGNYRFLVEINPRLLPGSYSFYLGIHDMSGNGLTLDLVERAGSFTVLPIAEGNAARYPLKISLGKVRIDGKWSLSKFE